MDEEWGDSFTIAWNRALALCSRALVKFAKASTFITFLKDEQISGQETTNLTLSPALLVHPAAGAAQSAAGSQADGRKEARVLGTAKFPSFCLLQSPRFNSQILKWKTIRRDLESSL